MNKDACRIWLAVIALLSVSLLVQAQSPSVTDIFLAHLAKRQGGWVAGKLVNITHRPGYDNQPQFLPDGRSLLYTSIREDGQADIYRYSLLNGSTARITETAESEYSPTVTPDRKFFSVVRVEADKTQRLWKFPLGGGQPTLVLENIKPVGYHVWIDEAAVALFILGSPNTLQLADVRTQKAEVVHENIGRSLHRVPGQNKISFVHKVSEKQWVIKELDLKTKETAAVMETLPGSEDYVWLPDGSLLMANDSKLFSYHPGRDSRWREIADLSSFGIKGITRLAVNAQGDRLALVAIEK